MMKRQNPIIRGFYPDPSICRRGEDYFLVNSSFDYFPGLPLFHSKNLVEWEQIGNCLSRDSQLDLIGSPSSLGIFAPTIRFINDRFYIIFTNTNIGENLLISATDPFGEWSEPLVLKDWGGIDPSLFQDTDGKVYVQGTAERYGEKKGIYQSQIDLETGELLTPRTLISTGSGHKSPEGPHLYRKGEYYYLMMAEGGTEYGHMETIFRSHHVNGPFLPYENNPILTNRSTSSKIQCVGHGDLVDTPTDEWWMACLGVRIKGSHNYYHFLGRETNIVPMIWTQDDWPIAATMELRYDYPLFADYGLEEQESHSYDFATMTAFPQEWLYIANPIKENYQLSEMGLQLQGTTNLSEIGQPTFVGLRQDEFDYSFEATFDPATSFVETGISVYMSHSFHIDFFIESKEGQTLLWLRKKIASLESLEQVAVLDGNDLHLKVSCDGVYYTFAYYQNQEWQVVGKVETIFLSTEISGTFTGVLLGLYAAVGTGIIKKVQIEKHHEQAK